ncbi:MAG: DUF1552 domain-containing protein [Oligoflexales bacterium]
MSFKKDISKRTFLKLSGQSLLFLPLSNFMLWNGRLEAQDGIPAEPMRFFTAFFPNGAPNNTWNFQDNLSAFASFSGKMTPIINLNNGAAMQTNLSDGHGPGAATAFTGKKITSNEKETCGSATIDVQIGEQLSGNGPLKHLAVTLGTESRHHTGIHGKHTFVRSWKNPTTPISSIQNPQDIFNRIVGAEFAAPEDKQKYFDRKLSILDTVVNQYKELTSERYGLSSRGKNLLENHLESLRDLELKVKNVAAEANQACQPLQVNAQNLGSPVDRKMWVEAFAVQMEMLVYAIKCDIVRFGSISFGELAQYYTMPGASISGHEAAHDKNVPAFNESIKFTMTQYAKLFSGLESNTFADGSTLLDKTVIYMATELGDQSRTGHNVNETVSLIAGGTGINANGRGRIVDANGKNINDSILTAYKAVGINQSVVGDEEFCSGPLV